MVSTPAPPNTKIEAARELLLASKRNLQLLDAQIEILQGGRVAIEPANDVSSEHRVAWLGAVDDVDELDGILMGSVSAGSTFGWDNKKTGTIRNREDAAFVCTNIFVLSAHMSQNRESNAARQFFEDPTFEDAGSSSKPFNPYLRLIDNNTGRSLITGMTTGTLATGQTSAPINNDLGAIPFSFLTSPRPGLGPNVKNKLFSEFTIPRGATVRAEIYNLGVISDSEDIDRCYVSLFGYKVFGA